jgi:hypothetical protein
MIDPPEAIIHLSDVSGDKKSAAAAKRSEDALRGFFLEFLHDQGRGISGLRFQQPMEMLGHQNPTDEQAVGLLAYFLEALEEATAKAGSDSVSGGTGIPSLRSGPALPVHGHGQDGRGTSK